MLLMIKFIFSQSTEEDEPQPPPPAHVPEGTERPDLCQLQLEQCHSLQCPYGESRDYDATGCVVCSCQNPCEQHDCPNGSICAVDYRPGDEENAFFPVCRQGNIIFLSFSILIFWYVKYWISIIIELYCFVIIFVIISKILAEKPGECPILANSSRCDRECNSDADCRGDKKCCSAGCGLSCVPPVEDITQAPERVYPNANVPGGNWLLYLKYNCSFFYKLIFELKHLYPDLLKMCLQKKLMWLLMRVAMPH